MQASESRVSPNSSTEGLWVLALGEAESASIKKSLWDCLQQNSKCFKVDTRASMQELGADATEQKNYNDSPTSVVTVTPYLCSTR